MKDKKLLGSIFLLAGTAIGSGMLSLPIALAKYGIFFSCFIMLLLVWVTYFSSIIRCELNIHSDARFSLQDVGKYFGGKTACQIGNISFKLLSYSLLAAYLSGASDLFNAFLGKCNIPVVNSRVVVVAFSLLIIALLMSSANAIVRANKALFILMIAILSAVIVRLLAKLDISSARIPQVSNRLLALSILSALPIVFTSFGFQTSLHSVTRFVENDRELIKKSCLWGSIVPAIVYISWVSCIMFVIFNNDHELFKKMCSGDAKIDDLVASITDAFNYQHLGIVIWVISALALLTSAIGVGIGVFDEWQLFFEKRSQGAKWMSALASILPPALIAMVTPNAFIKVLSIAGMILTVLAIFLPCFLYIKMAKKKSIEISGPKMAGIVILTIFGILICVSGVFDIALPPK